MSAKIFTPLLLTLLASLGHCLDDAGMRPRTVYQLLTDRFARTDGSTTASCPIRSYCGGSWNGIVDHLDYIQGMGFDTIWISPVVQNIEGYTHWGNAYHGYWAHDPRYLNDHFGSAQDLQALSKALHDKGMYLMVDVVANHVATSSAPDAFKPDSSYGPFSTPADYHQPFCLIDYNNETSVQVCSVGDTYVPLPDLNTESEHVVDFWYGWIRDLVRDYSIDAIRIDTVRNVRKSFWPGYVDAAGVYNVGEIFDGDTDYVAAFQQDAKINPLNYPVRINLVPAFQSTNGDMGALVSTIKAAEAGFVDTSLLGMFVNNQDNPRFESLTTDDALRRNVQAFPFVFDGVPIMYYGSETGFHGGNDPDNREAFWPTGYNTSSSMYHFFTLLNTIRRAAGAASSSFYTNNAKVTQLTSNEMLIVKQPLVSILSNRGSGSSTSSNLTLASSATGWESNVNVVDALSCATYKTDSNGDLAVGVTNGMPQIFMLASQKGEVCGSS